METTRSKTKPEKRIVYETSTAITRENRCFTCNHWGASRRSTPLTTDVTNLNGPESFWVESPIFRGKAITKKLESRTFTTGWSETNHQRRRRLACEALTCAVNAARSSCCLEKDARPCSTSVTSVHTNSTVGTVIVSASTTSNEDAVSTVKPNADKKARADKKEAASVSWLGRWKYPNCRLRPVRP